jgi:hypothetical protein
MPIPKLKGKMTRQQVMEKYAELGWNKKIEFPWVEMHRGQPVLLKYLFEADTMQCSNRACRHQLTFVTLMPHGVYWTCATCRRTMGPMAWEDGMLLNPPNGEPISVSEAWETIAITNQTLPIGLKPVSTGEVVQII